jgi:hypothetical protein
MLTGSLCCCFQAFDLLDVAPPAIPTVTLSLRHRTPEVRSYRRHVLPITH